MRLFTGLDLPTDVLIRLDSLLAMLRPEAPIKWSPLENLHITTKFIGEWPERQFERLDAVLEPLRFGEPIDVRVGGLGWYPDAASPRVLLAGVDGGPALTQLAGRTDGALAELGIVKEQHAYSPHVTLARVKSAGTLQSLWVEGLRAKVEELRSEPIGTFSASGFYLYRSEPGSGGSIYRKVRFYSFESASFQPASSQPAALAKKS